MSRSGYNDDGDQWALIRWRGAVRSSIKGARGQAFLRELAAAMDAMPDKRLIAEEAIVDGCMCTLGVAAAARGNNMDELGGAMESQDWRHIANSLGISEAMVREVMHENDAAIYPYEWVDIVGPPCRNSWRHPQIQRPSLRAEERRWIYMRNWVRKHTTEGIRHA